MSHGQRIMVVAVGVAVFTGLVLRAVTVHSVGNAPLIYRVTTNNNDLDGVEGVAAPGRLVELWYRQRNFREGIESADPARSLQLVRLEEPRHSGADRAAPGPTAAGSGTSPTCARAPR